MRPRLRLSTVRDAEQIIGHLLRVGVILAASVVTIGAMIYLLQHGSEPPGHHVFRGEPADLRTLPGIISDAAAVQPEGVIQLGLLLLVATPIARVLFSVFAFAVQRDWTYVVITLFVFAVLMYGLLGKHP